VHTARSLCNHMSCLVGHVGPTTLQVGCSLAAAICWGIMNPNSGANFPENLPSDFIVGLAKPWLGTWVSVRHDWKPSSDEIPRKDSPTRSTDSSSSEDSEDSDSDSESSSQNAMEKSENFAHTKLSPQWSRLRSGPSSRSASLLVGEEWQFRNFIDFQRSLEFQNGTATQPPMNPTSAPLGHTLYT